METCIRVLRNKKLKLNNFLLKEFKPGFCPSPNEVGQLCAFTCSSDSNCANDLKCCTNICGGTQCVKPQSTVQKLTKPGSCPSSIGLIGICLQGCMDDSSCSGNLKCCSNGCGRTCQVPV